jgi:hypothetical protein
MLSIIVVHATSPFGLVKGVHWQLPLAAIVPFKFGTIGFFLISGFLLGERVDRRNPVEYFNRRLQRVFVPWLLWLVVTSAAYVIAVLAMGGFTLSIGGSLRLGYGVVVHHLWYTAFWFVPNFLICIAVLLVFRRHLYSLKLGAFFLAVNLVYVVNIYRLWFPSLHTQALFAFVFYLWLGSYIAENFAKVSRSLARISISAVLVLAVIAGMLSYLESHLLVVLNNPDPANTLRATNQIFSICMVLVLFKLTSATWPRFIDVRRQTFGLYLSHIFVLHVLVNILKFASRYVRVALWTADIRAISLWIVLSLATYLCSLGITAWLAEKSNLSWIVGLPSQNPPPLPIADALDRHAQAS